MLAIILSTVLRILSLLGTVLGITQALNNKPTAVEQQPYIIANTATTILNYIADATIGFPKVLFEETQTQTDIAVAQSAILNAILDLTNGTTPVSLPPTPPAGYGGNTATQIGDAVWLYATGFPSGNALGALEEIRYHAVQLDTAQGGYPLTNEPGWWIGGPFYNPAHTPNPGFQVFPLDYTTILGTDATPDAWLERAYSSFNWNTPFDGQPTLLGSDGFRYFLPWLTQPEFDRIKAAMFAPSGLTAPVWPGLTGVTLGSPVALSPTTTITGPMAGVIIDITASAPRQQMAVIGGIQGLRFCGALTFIDDNGQAERPQALGFAMEVLMPKSMVVAASCGIRADVAVSGTATPFTIP